MSNQVHYAGLDVETLVGALSPENLMAASSNEAGQGSLVAEVDERTQWMKKITDAAIHYHHAGFPEPRLVASPLKNPVVSAIAYCYGYVLKWDSTVEMAVDGHYKKYCDVLEHRSDLHQSYFAPATPVVFQLIFEAVFESKRHPTVKREFVDGFIGNALLKCFTETVVCSLEEAIAYVVNEAGLPVRTHRWQKKPGATRRTGQGHHSIVRVYDRLYPKYRNVPRSLYED